MFAMAYKMPKCPPFTATQPPLGNNSLTFSDQLSQYQFMNLHTSIDYRSNQAFELLRPHIY
jgi:hypothetical protein